MRTLAFVVVAMVVTTAGCAAETALPRDVVPTSVGELEITLIGHGSLMFKVAGKVVHVDPYSRLADYSQLPKADLVLITHGHRDHLDPAALAAVRSGDTVVIISPACEEQVEGAQILGNGEERLVLGWTITAVPAYNLVHMRSAGAPYHPRGEGNGYVIAFGDTRVYVAGDTENTPEMKALRDVSIAFLPMNLPYTMTPEMVADAARAFRPAILYPYHYSDTDPARLEALLVGEEGIEVRVRPMK